MMPRNERDGVYFRPLTIDEQILISTARVAERSITVAARLGERMYRPKKEARGLIDTLRQAEARRDSWLRCKRLGIDYPFTDRGYPAFS